MAVNSETESETETETETETEADPGSFREGSAARSAADPIRIEGSQVLLTAIAVDDPTVVSVLARLDPAERPDAVRRMLGIGARALMETAVGVDLAAIDDRVTRSIERATALAEAQVRTIVADAERVLRDTLDPDTRTSAMARAITEMDSVRASIFETVDPHRTDSHVGTLLASLASMLGPGGQLEARLSAAFDPASDDSGLAVFRRDVDRRFTELREVLAYQRGRQGEAEVGTRKGFDYEDDLEARLRLLCRPLGAVVTRTSNESGSIKDCLVGDLVVTLPSGDRIVVEAKHTTRVGLDGSGGILAELDRAIANREASFAICLSASNAFPAEVGAFGVYGNRVLAVDDGDDTMLDVALRWVAMAAVVERRGSETIDTERIAASTDRIKRLTKSFSTQRRALTDSIDAISRVRDGLDEVRREIVAQIDEIEFEIAARESIALRVVGDQ
jgi:hypothetical protein